MTIECNHCGNEPIEPDEDGLYWDGDGEACQWCGFPGHVHVEDWGCHEDGDPATASWSEHDWDDEAHCNDLKCEDCAEAWARSNWFDRVVFDPEVWD